MASRDTATSGGVAPGELTTRRAGFAHGHMQQIQRGRLLAAITHAVSEQGIGSVTVAKVVESAGVSRRTFYETFEDCEDCLLAALDVAVTRAGAQVLPAYQAAQGTWRSARASGTLGAAGVPRRATPRRAPADRPVACAGPRALERRQQLLERITSVIDDGRAARSSSGSEPPQLAAEGVVGAVASVLHARLTSARPEGLIELANPLMGMIVLPYLGIAAAHKELELVVPRTNPDGSDNDSSDDLLKSLNMRLTYRTMRVLAAIGSHPGASNRKIATAAGVGDQGQISKLLMRLRKLGLIENSGTGATAKGEPNAWRLTVTGRQVERALHI